MRAADRRVRDLATTARAATAHAPLAPCPVRAQTDGRQLGPRAERLVDGRRLVARLEGDSLRAGRRAREAARRPAGAGVPERPLVQRARRGACVHARTQPGADGHRAPRTAQPAQRERDHGRAPAQSRFLAPRVARAMAIPEPRARLLVEAVMRKLRSVTDDDLRFPAILLK